LRQALRFVAWRARREARRELARPAQYRGFIQINLVRH
jgi:hypothetical protein